MATPITNTVVYTLPSSNPVQINSGSVFVNGTFSVQYTYKADGSFDSAAVLSADLITTNPANTTPNMVNTYKDVTPVGDFGLNYGGDHQGASIDFDAATGALTVKFQELKANTNNAVGTAQTGLDKDYNQIGFSFIDPNAKSANDDYTADRTLTINSVETRYFYEGTDRSGAPKTTNNAQIDNTGGNDDTLTAACYTKGTLIMTANGEVAIEDLAVGDQLMTTSGTLEPVIWLGNSTIHCERQLNKDKAYPVRIAKDTFGTNLPKRDLFVSPDHSLYIDGVMIPAYCLINGSTITQDRTETLVTYYHVELPKHNAILAEGLPAESYLETSEANRNFFKAGTASNATNVTKLDTQYPACPEGTPAWQHIWDTQGYAPLIQSGPILEVVQAKLAVRAQELNAKAAKVELKSQLQAA